MTNMKYKLSDYNYILKKDDDTFIGMNLINQIIFSLDNECYNLLIDNKEDVGRLQSINLSLFNALRKLGIIIPEKNNELEGINLRNRLSVYSTQMYRMTIIPTLECNLKCWYCYEEHKLGRMNYDVIKSVYSFVKKTIKDNNLRYFHLDWFGGEPLLCFDDIIYPVSKKIKQLCDQSNIVFFNGITTNGVLINKEMVKKILKIDLNKFQITLDGNKEQHNKVKKIHIKSL